MDAHCPDWRRTARFRPITRPRRTWSCNLTLRKITLLTNYYQDVRNICTSHVITDDYTRLPISEIMTEGYAEYYKYDCNKFYNAYRDE